MSRALKGRIVFGESVIQERIKKLLTRLENHLSSLKAGQQYRCSSWDNTKRHLEQGDYYITRNALCCMDDDEDVLPPIEGSYRSDHFSYLTIDWKALIADISSYVAQCYGIFDDNYELPKELRKEIGFEKRELEERALLALAQEKLESMQVMSS